MKLIPLTSKKNPGLFAKVDDDDYEYLSQFKWHADKGLKNKTFYAKRTIHKKKSPTGKVMGVAMHREIMKVTDVKIHIDHKNHDSLDNRKENLREATRFENARNRVGYGSSKFLGVSRKSNSIKWAAMIRVNNKLK